ncbi:hypothetical protein V2J09_017218 [Rumex salicifolius]
MVQLLTHGFHTTSLKPLRLISQHFLYLSVATPLGIYSGTDLGGTAQAISVLGSNKPDISALVDHYELAT